MSSVNLAWRLMGRSSCRLSGCLGVFSIRETLRYCPLKRFGSANDGGYLMFENLTEPLDTGYSYGVGTNDDWPCEVSRRYHVPVHEYDCFDPARPICDGGKFIFHNECVGNRTENRESHF